MGQKVDVSGTGYDLKGGKPLIGGTAYAIKKGRTLKDGTGYDISLLSGTPISELPVGNTVKIAVNGTLRDFLIVHQGLPSSMYDDSCNGTWLLMKDAYEKRQWNSVSSNSYKTSTIHSYLNGTFLNLLDAGIKNEIKNVKLPYVNGTGGADVASGAKGLSCKVFLLSGYELGWSQSDDDKFPVDGDSLSYFNNIGDFDIKRVVRFNGSVCIWWLRSPININSNAVWVIMENGYRDYYDATSGPFGIRPAFILPSDTLVSDDGTIVV